LAGIIVTQRERFGVGTISGSILIFGDGILKNICREFPVRFAIQGLDDEYGTMAQVQAIASQAGGPVEILALPECRHSPQRDQPEAVLAATAAFVNKLSGTN
jgi:hypothetical protein